MKKILALVAFTLLASCSNGTTDGYTFEKGTKRITPNLEIKVVLYPSLDSLKVNYPHNANAKRLPADRELMAYSVIGHGVCTIHMIDPAVRYMPEFFGHELTHCLYGEFHPSQNG